MLLFSGSNITAPFRVTELVCVWSYGTCVSKDGQNYAGNRPETLFGYECIQPQDSMAGRWSEESVH